LYVSIDGDVLQAWVIFPEKINWLGDVKQLVHTNEKARVPYKADKVLVTLERNGESQGQPNQTRIRQAVLVDIKAERGSSTLTANRVKAVVQYVNSSTTKEVLYKDVSYFTQLVFEVRSCIIS
jgi:hypothetical protein